MKSSWIGIGFSHHSVPSLSNTAMRSSTGTACDPCSPQTRRTKSTMASFEGLSFHVVNGSAAMRGRAFELVALALRGGLQERFDEPLGAEPCRCLARREVLERGHVLLDEGRRGHDSPQLLADVERVVGRVHVLLERIDPQIPQASAPSVKRSPPRTSRLLFGSGPSSC